MSCWLLRYVGQQYKAPSLAAHDNKLAPDVSVAMPPFHPADSVARRFVIALSRQPPIASSWLLPTPSFKCTFTSGTLVKRV